MTGSASFPTQLFTTFYVGDRLYGVDVIKVQEITRAMPTSAVPLAPSYVHGLINLRGQIATAIGLRELFGLQPQKDFAHMNIVCQVNDLLLSFLVDRIGDVIEVSKDMYEKTPETVPQDVRRFMTGVYKLPNELMSVIDIETILTVINES